MTPAARPQVLALFAPSDAERVAPVLAALRDGGVAVAESASAADPAARVLFFASGESTSPGPLLRAALDARKSMALFAVVLDATGDTVLRPWNLPVVLDARTGSGTSLARALRPHLGDPGDPPPPPKSATPPRAFISYSGRDKAFVTRLKAWLVTQGWDAWDYQTSERERVALHSELGRRIAESAAVLFVLTPDWFQSKDSRGELDCAAGLKKEAEFLVARKCDVSAIKQSNYSGGALRIDFTADEPAAFRLLADRLKQIKAAR